MTDGNDQTRLIDWQQCKAFEAAWCEGRPRPIEEFLPPDDDPHYLPMLEELIHIDLEYSWKSHCRESEGTLAGEQSETLQQPPQVESYLARFHRIEQPEILERLLKQEFFVRNLYGDQPGEEEYRCRFPHVTFSQEEPESDVPFEKPPLGDSPQLRTDSPGLSRPVEQPESFPRSFGEYDLLEELGRGGMGIVYKACQRNADRIVALKVIRNNPLLDMSSKTRAGLIERFRTEARAAARLVHDNIVTVYDVGEVDGEYYFSMFYVDGESLTERLVDGPLSNRVAVEYLEPVARAVHVAHQSGILHRDLKPHNILVDSKSNRPLVADFGLAKLLEGREQLTHDGEVIGTPAYMSPEQASDSSTVTTLSDVYAIGATLYHLLTNRPPFDAGTLMELFRQVIDTEPVPPSQLNPRVDRDLETICLKCLQKETSARYKSAEALADDMARYLGGEPILARPVGRPERIVRWVRRNPATAAASASALVFLFAAFVAASVGYVKTRAALAQSEINLQKARTTVDELYTEVSESDLLNRPGMQPLRKKLLQRALGHYQQFVEENDGVESLRDELAATWFRIGKITKDIGTLQNALTAFEQARTIQSIRLHEEPENIERLGELASTVNAIGATLSQLGRQEQALAAFHEAKDLREKLVDLAPGQVEHRRVLANTLMNIGLAEKSRGNYATARRQLSAAQRLRSSLSAEGETVDLVQRDLAMGAFNLGNLDIQDEKGGSLPQAARHLQDAIDRFEALLRTSPSDLDNLNRLAICYRTIGDLSENPQRQAEMYAKAARRMEQLVLENPRVIKYRDDMAGVLLDLGRVEIGRGQVAAAAIAFTRSIEVMQPAVDDENGQDVYSPNYATALQALSSAQIALGRQSQALKNLQKARNHLIKLNEQFPDDKQLKGQLETTEGMIRRLKE